MPFTKQEGQPGSDFCQRRLSLGVQRSRHPSRLPGFDGICLFVVLRGDPKAGMSERAGHIVRHGPCFER